MSKGRGKRIVIKFDKALLGDVEGNQGAFTVTGMEKSPLFYGEPVLREYAVEKVERYPLTVFWEDDFSGQMDGVEVGENGLVLESSEATEDVGWSRNTFASGNPSTGTRGWEFQPTEDITVLKLRCFGEANRNEKLYLWKVSDQSLLASITIPCAAEQWNEHELLTPIQLEQGQKYIIAIDLFSGQGYKRENITSVSGEFDARIGFIGGRVVTSIESYPANTTEWITGVDIVFGKPAAYISPGTYTIVTPADTLPVTPRLKWTEDLPEGTSITAEYAVNQDALTPPAAWTAVSNAGLLTIPDPATGYFLWLRFTLATIDPAVTPTLLSVWLEEAEAPPDTIILTMAETGRFNDTEGDLTVAYDQTLGNLAGTRPVASFEESFTPTDLEPTPVHEHTITVTGIPVVTLIPVLYHDYPDFAEHTIAVTTGPVSVAFIHVTDIPP